MPYTKGIVSAFYGLLAKPYGTLDLSSGSAVAVGTDTTPFVAAYPWVDGIGYGTKFSNPGTLPTGAVNAAFFNHDASVLFLAHDTSPFVSAYAWSVSGFGTKFSNPGTLPDGNCTGVSIRFQSASTFDHVALSSESTVFTQVYTFSKSGAGWVGKFGDPATPPTGLASDCAFSPDGASLAFSHNTTPFITTYPWSGSGFGVKYANPAVLGGTQGTGVRFSATSASIALSHGGAAGDNISAWAFASGFGTKFAAPLLPPGFAPNFGAHVAFNHSGDAIVLGHDFNGTVGGLTGWDWEDASGFGTRFNAISPVITGRAAPAWNESGSTFFLSRTTTPFIQARSWIVGGGFGTLYSNPASLPNTDANCVAVAP